MFIVLGIYIFALSQQSKKQKSLAPIDVRVKQYFNPSQNFSLCVREMSEMFRIVPGCCSIKPDEPKMQYRYHKEKKEHCIAYSKKPNRFDQLKHRNKPINTLKHFLNLTSKYLWMFQVLKSNYFFSFSV